MEWLAENWETVLLVVSLVGNVLFPASLAKVIKVLKRALEIMAKSVEDQDVAGRVKSEVSILTRGEPKSVEDALLEAVSKVDPKEKHEPKRKERKGKKVLRFLGRLAMGAVKRRLG